MSTTSAVPELLAEFVDRSGAGRGATADQQCIAAANATMVRDRCINFGVDSAAVHTLAHVLDAMAATDAFVATVRDELLAADGGAPGAVVVVGDQRVADALDRAGVSVAPAPVDFEPATGYGIPPTSGFVDDPICAANGNMIHQELDLEFAGLADALDVRRTYNSLLSSRAGAFGHGFTSILDVGLVTRGGSADAPDRLEVDLPDGATAAFVRTPAGWASSGRRLRDVEQLGDGWMVRTGPRHGYRFDEIGSLVAWTCGVAEVVVTRDSAGRIVGLREERSGRRVHVDWSDGRVAQIATGDGRRVTYTYRRDGRLVRVVGGGGGRRTYEWDDGLLTAVVDADGVRLFANEYGLDGRVIRQRSPFGRVTTYRYDGAGLTVITDDAGTRQAMVHDSRGNLTAVVDADGSAMRLTYDHADRVTQVVERDGATWRYQFDPGTGDLIRRTDPDGRCVEWAWDPHGRVVATTDRAGNTTRFAYPKHSSAVTTPSRVVDAGGASTIDVDIGLDRPRSVTDADGVVVEYEFDPDGQLSAVTDAHGHRTTLEYDGAGRLVRRTDPLGATTRVEYDASGRLAAYDRAGAVGTFVRTAAGRVVGGTEPGYGTGERWTATLGDHGAPITLTDACGNTLRLDYDRMGDVVAITTAGGSTFHQFHDALGRPVGAADPSGATSHLHYDVAGRVVEAVDAAGRRFRRELDELGRTIRSIAPDGAATTCTYHPGGQIASVTSPDGRTWSSTVDHAGRTTSVTDPAGHRTEFGYTAAGRLAERRSPAGAVERIDYDAAGRPAAVTGGDGVRHAFERDAAGRLVAVERGRVRDEFGRDASGRVIRHRSGAGPTVLGWDYDAAGRLVAARDGTGSTHEYLWDARGLLVAAFDPAGGALRYRYDACGRLVEQIAPGDRVTSFHYATSGHPDRVVDPAGVTTWFDRDPSGVLIGRRSGDDGWAAVLDGAGRPVERVDLTGALLARFGYDAAGRLVTAGADGILERFAWDRADRLVATTLEVGAGAVTTVVERDADGDRPALHHPPPPPTACDPGGRLLMDRDGSAYHYDGAGRIARIERADGADTAFEYADDGLLAVERGPRGTRRFGYDAAGRVAAITIDGGGTTAFEYDEAGRRAGERRADGSRVRFEWSGLSRLTAVAVTDRDGVEHHAAIVADAFGRPVRVGDRDVTRAEPGRATPAERRTGELTFLGARVHDSVTNQFLSPDPLLPVPGSLGAASAYTYLWHDPVNHVDPSGMRPIGIREWEAIRAREERGSLGGLFEAMADDPWGTLAMAGVLTAGVALVMTGAGAIGAPMLLGMGLAAAAGLATGSLSPRDVAIGGVVGAAGGAVASTLRVGAISLPGALVRQGTVGAAGEIGGRMAAGEPVDLYDGVVAGALSAATFGAGERFAPASLGRQFLLGAGTGGGAHLAGRALTGEPLDARHALLEAGFGGLGGIVDVGAADRYLDRPLGLVQPELTARPVAMSWAEWLLLAETGLVLRDVAPHHDEAP